MRTTVLANPGHRNPFIHPFPIKGFTGLLGPMKPTPDKNPGTHSAFSRCCVQSDRSHSDIREKLRKDGFLLALLPG
jgi:hypothetical protein